MVLASFPGWGCAPHGLPCRLQRGEGKSLATSSRSINGNELLTNKTKKAPNKPQPKTVARELQMRRRLGKQHRETVSPPPSFFLGAAWHHGRTLPMCDSQGEDLVGKGCLEVHTCPCKSAQFPRKAWSFSSPGSVTVQKVPFTSHDPGELQSRRTLPGRSWLCPRPQEGWREEPGRGPGRPDSRPATQAFPTVRTGCSCLLFLSLPSSCKR